MHVFDIDTTKSTDELLDHVRSCAQQASRTGNGVFVVTAFSNLLVKLSKDAEATARKVLWATWILLEMTVILLFITLAMMVKDFLK